MSNQNYKFCSNCGEKLPVKNKFCTNCGTVQNNIEEVGQEEFKNENIPQNEAIQKDIEEETSEYKDDPLRETTEYSSQIKYLNLKNRERKGRNICYFISFFGFIMIVSPSIFNIEGMNGGYALSLIGMLIMVSLFLTAILVFKDRVKVFDSIIAGENIIVYWNYREREWKKYKDDEYREAKSTNKGMYIFMIILCSIVFLPFILFSEEGLVMGGILIALIAILGIAAFVGTSLAKNKDKAGFVIIARDGMLMNKNFHCWKGFGVKFEGAGYCTEDSSVIEINYRASYYRHQHSIQTVIVPIPKGEELRAEEVISKLVRCH